MSMDPIEIFISFTFRKGHSVAQRKFKTTHLVTRVVGAAEEVVCETDPVFKTRKEDSAGDGRGQEVEGTELANCSSLPTSG